MKKFTYIPLFVLLCVFAACSEDTINALESGSITGTVVTEGDYDPVENVRISTTPNTSTVFTDENGEFVIHNVPVDQYSVEARKEGLLTQFQAAEVLSEAEANVIFEMQPEDANNREPSAPELISPEDETEGIPITQEFTWNSMDPDSDTLTYELELRNDRNNEVLRYAELTDTTLTVEDLQYGYKYFWQVKVSDGVNDPVLSKLFSFNTLEFPKNRFVYVKEIAGNNVIFARDHEDNEYQLTSAQDNSFRPRKNSRTEKIAFLRTVGSRTQLFTMNLDGSQEKQVTSNIAVNGFNMEKVDFSWADNGARLVYPNFEKLYKINVDGSGNTLIYEEPDGKFITEVDVSNDNTRIILLTNNADGYNASIYSINPEGEFMDTVISGFPGALGGLNISVDNQKVLYTRDISGFQSQDYRQLNSRMFVYDFSTNESTDISGDKLDGTNDLDPRFSPSEAQVTFVNTSNDGISEKNIYRSEVAGAADDGGDAGNREELYPNSKMPDWK